VPLRAFVSSWQERYCLFYPPPGHQGTKNTRRGNTGLSAPSCLRVFVAGKDVDFIIRHQGTKAQRIHEGEIPALVHLRAFVSLWQERYCLFYPPPGHQGTKNTRRGNTGLSAPSCLRVFVAGKDVDFFIRHQGTKAQRIHEGEIPDLVYLRAFVSSWQNKDILYLFNRLR